MRRARLLCLCLAPGLACGDDGGRAEDAGGSQPTSVTVASSPPGGSSTGDADATAPTTGGDEPGTAATGGSTTTGELDTGDPSLPGDSTTTGAPTSFTTDPSAGETSFETDPYECESVLTATVRDFKIEHPDFEDYTSDLGLKGIVADALGPDQKPVYVAGGPTAQTAGPEHFAQWYNATPGFNLAFAVEMMLTEVQPGMFSYQNDAFYPVDGQGFGNEGNPHNYHFTTELHTTFTYEGGEQFTFTGDDDLWLFINGRLAIDLGGVHPQLSQSVDLDADAAKLGIQVGGTYAMDLFHAERHTDESHFRIDTSIRCFTIPG